MNSVALPEEFLQRLPLIVGDQNWPAVLHSFSALKPAVLRVNTLLVVADDLVAELKENGFSVKRIEWKPDTIVLPHKQRQKILDSSWYEKGLLYSQSLSSQLAPLVLNPRPGEEILDLCAAPGGKTLQMACMMNDTGRIAAVEKVKARFFKLKANVNHQHANCVDTYLTDGAGVWRKTPERFDRVMLDAPCSSESRFKAGHPETFQHWKLKKIKEMSKKQKALIQSAIKCLKPGGVMVYSTCSFAPEENEAVVDFALKRFAEAIDIEPVELPIDNVQYGLPGWREKPFHDSIRKSIRVLPNELMDGFYICKIRKLRPTIQ